MSSQPPRDRSEIVSDDTAVSQVPWHSVQRRLSSMMVAVSSTASSSSVNSGSKLCGINSCCSVDTGLTFLIPAQVSLACGPREAALFSAPACLDAVASLWPCSGCFLFVCLFVCFCCCCCLFVCLFRSSAWRVLLLLFSHFAAAKRLIRDQFCFKSNITKKNIKKCTRVYAHATGLKTMRSQHYVPSIESLSPQNRLRYIKEPRFTI